MTKRPLRKTAVFLVLVLTLAFAFTLGIGLASADSQPALYMNIVADSDVASGVYRLDVSLEAPQASTLKMLFSLLSYDPALIQPVVGPEDMIQTPGASLTPADGQDAVSAVGSALQDEDFLLAANWWQPDEYSRVAIATTLAGGNKSVTAGSSTLMYSFYFKFVGSYTLADVTATTFILEGDRSQGSLVSQLYNGDNIDYAYGAQAKLDTTDYYLTNDSTQTNQIQIKTPANTQLKQLGPCTVTMTGDPYNGGLLVNVQDPNPYYATTGAYTVTIGGAPYSMVGGENQLPLSASIVAGTAYSATGAAVTPVSGYTVAVDTPDLTGATDVTAAPKPTVTVSSGSALKGQTAPVTVSIANNPGLTEFNIVVTPGAGYADYFQATPTIAKGAGFEGIQTTVNADNSVTITYSGPALSADGIICTVTYTAKAGAELTATPVTLTLGLTGFSADDKTCTPAGVAGGLSVIDYLLGDVDNNGSVDLYDAGLIARFRAGLYTLSATQKMAADVDKNGSVELYDAGLIARFRAGLISGF